MWHIADPIPEYPNCPELDRLLVELSTNTDRIPMPLTFCSPRPLIWNVTPTPPMLNLTEPDNGWPLLTLCIESENSL